MGRAVRETYEWAIDHGAHPNPMGLVLGMEVVEKDGRRYIMSDLMTGSRLLLDVVLKVAIEAAIGCLRIFHHMMAEGAPKNDVGAIVGEVIAGYHAIKWEQ